MFQLPTTPELWRWLKPRKSVKCGTLRRKLIYKGNRGDRTSGIGRARKGKGGGNGRLDRVTAGKQASKQESRSVS